MAGSVTTVKTASWGISTALGQSVVAGVVTDWDDGEEPSLQPEQNEMGSVINQTMNDIHYTANMTVQVKAETDKPAAGTQVSIDGTAWYVTSSRVTESNNAYRKIAVSLERYKLCNATEACPGIANGSSAS